MNCDVGLKLKQGVATVQSSVPANGYFDITIKISGFSSVPTCVASLHVTSGASPNWANVMIAIRECSSSTFTVRIYNNNTTAYSPMYIDWIAVGK